MKSKLNLIIQGTTAGLNNIYVSPNLDITNKSIVETLKDERILAAQIANQSIVYSVQTINDCKVYSLIITDITDFTGRSGYYSIKLYSTIDYKVKNVTGLLNELNQKYLYFKNNNDLNNQDYSEILNQADIQSQNRIISNKLISTAFIQYYDKDNVEYNINNDAVYAVEKLYLFDHEKALNEEQIKYQGLIGFEDFKKNVKFFEVNNSDGVLKKIIINGKELSHTIFPESFMSFRLKDDSVSYFTKDDTSSKQAIFNHNNILDIKRKVTFVQQPTKTKEPAKEPAKGPTKGPTKKGEQSTFQKILIVLFILGVGVSFYFFLDKEPTNKTNTNTNLTTENSADSSLFNFKVTNNSVKAFYNCKLFTSEFNDSLKKRYIIKKENSDTCFIVKTNKKYFTSLKKSDIDYLNIDSTESEIFIKELKDVCKCDVSDDLKTQPVDENIKAKPSSAEGKKKKKTPSKTDQKTVNEDIKIEM